MVKLSQHKYLPYPHLNEMLPFFLCISLYAWKTKLKVPDKTFVSIHITNWFIIINFAFFNRPWRHINNTAGPCDTGDSSFPTNTVQNWAHTKSDILSTRFITAARWWWIVFAIIANWTTHIEIKCTEHITRVIGTADFGVKTAHWELSDWFIY